MSVSSMWTFQEDCESLIKQSTVMLISKTHDDDDDDDDDDHDLLVIAKYILPLIWQSGFLIN